jgi:hypothetical protein
VCGAGFKTKKGEDRVIFALFVFIAAESLLV